MSITVVINYMNRLDIDFRNDVQFRNCTFGASRGDNDLIVELIDVFERWCHRGKVVNRLLDRTLIAPVSLAVSQRGNSLPSAGLARSP